MTKKGFQYLLILLGLSYVAFMLGNGIISLTNPDEVFYTQIAKEMAQHKTWMTEYLFDAPQFEKPILLYWLLRIGLKVFPDPNFAARFFPALFGVLGVLATYFLSLTGFKNEKKAFISALVLMSCGLYIGLARTVFTDMIFSVLILFSLLSFYWGYCYRARKGPGILLFFIFSGLAVLAKGPLGFLIPFFIILTFLLIKREAKFLFCGYSLWGILIFIAVSFPWYVLMIKRYGSAFTHEFFYNDHIRRLLEAEHPGNDTWYFYPASIIGCIFPWSLYVLVSLVYLFKIARRNVNPMYIFLASWLCITFLIFQPAHSKLISYIFPLFPALALLTGDFIYNSILTERLNRLFWAISLVTGFILLLMATALLTQIPRFPNYLPYKTPAYFLVFILFFFSGLFCIFTWKYKFFKAVFVMAILMSLVSFSMLFILKQNESHFSSREASEYLLKNYSFSNPIICSKPFVRGVKYYTDREVVALDLPKRDFFSPHPILFLGSDKEVEDYLRRQGVAYCIFKKANIEDMERIERLSKKEFRFTVLKVIANEYVVRVEHSN